MHSCQNNLEISFTEKKTKHTPSVYSLFTNCSFDAAKNKLDCYRGKDCIEKFCKDLREQAMRISNYEKMILLTYEEKSYEEQKVCYICKREFIQIKMIKMRLNYIIKSEIIVIPPENLEELLIIFVI